jgi:hypothetical protein
VDQHLIDAVAKIRWSAGGEWSASLTPAECRALLAVLPEDAMVIRSLNASDTPRKILSGDPGDEHPDAS